MTLRQNLLWAGVILGLIFAAAPSSASPIAWSYQGVLFDDDTGESVALSNYLNTGSAFLIGYEAAPSGTAADGQTVNLAWVSHVGWTTPDQVYPTGDFRLSLLLKDLATGYEATLSVRGRGAVGYTLDDDWENGRPENWDIVDSWVAASLRDGQEQSVLLGSHQYDVRFFAREGDDGNAYLDAEVMVTSTPEPGTLILLAGGIVGVGMGTLTWSRRGGSRRNGKGDAARLT